tara:strand:- start:330 stop:1934 length:1605 start_codon:yes stop_codon:yes gene_type:complete
MLHNQSHLGLVVGGSLDRGLDIKLDKSSNLEEIKVGTYVTIHGTERRFLGMITDVRLEMIDQSLSQIPPDMSNPLIESSLSGTTFFGSLDVRPMLTIENQPVTNAPQPVKTVPSHFTKVTVASDEDINAVFGEEDKQHFHVGSPLDMEIRIHLDLENLVMRSSGVFGKSGTGKTFLTRLILLGIAQKQIAANLVFDMDNEYGWQGSSEAGHPVKGLKQIYPNRVEVFTLDQNYSVKHRHQIDHVVEIGFDDITASDIAVLGETFNITEIGVETTYLLQGRWGNSWLSTFFDKSETTSFEELADEFNAHPGALQALWRRLQNVKRFKFMRDGQGNESIQRVLNALKIGKTVVLEFGQYSRDLAAYMLVANLLTRRIHANYADMDDDSQQKPLIITIEEAHKFLNTDVGSRSIFGTIAREDRKNKVTLLVVDQRPSGIDDDVMSQLGTRFSCLLDDERDIDAVLSGNAARTELRRVLSRLESKQQALIFGHGVPMPIVIQTREYGSSDSYKAFPPVGTDDQADPEEWETLFKSPTE